MRHQSVISADHGPARSVARGAGRRRDLIAAALLAALLSCCWAINQWDLVSHLILPDADDMMRLAQVRDWLAGQATNDWTQHRLGPPAGGLIHWSRVNDVGIAALILAGRPLLGAFDAELVAVLAYPALLFACHLYLCARLGRRLWGLEAALVAIVLGALAYPGTTVFAPGRIDHHALQVVLMELCVLGATLRGTLKTGLLTGAAAAISLVVGLEAAPQTAALIGVVFAFWVVRGTRERARLAGLGLGLAFTTLPFLLLLRPTFWSPMLCDAFTPATASGALAGGGALALIALSTPRLRSWRARLLGGAALGGAALGAILFAYPACLAGPYGRVDPFLRREFISHITEANGMFADVSIGRGLQLVGLMLFALAASATIAWRDPRGWRRWGPVMAVVVTSGVITVFQVRGAYIGAPLSAPLLAGLILWVRAARPAQPLLLVGTWLCCTGMGWYAAPYAAQRLAPKADGPAKDYLTPLSPGTLCRGPETFRAIDRYPAGVMMVPTNTAAYIIGATRMSVVAAGYHRNDAANMDLYRYFLSPPATGVAIARRWHVRYVAFCPSDFGEIDVTTRFPQSLATALSFDRPPAGWRRLPLRGSRLRLYRIPD